MRFILKIRASNEGGNAMVHDPEFGAKMQQMLKEINAEAAYFTAVDGQRGGYVVVNIDDTSQIPAIAEPWLQWWKADVEWIPVMLPEDLAKAGPALARAVKQYG